MRYFTIASLAAFAVVALAIYVLQAMEQAFFERVQQEQGEFFAQVQADLARQQDETARSGLLLVHEAGHVNLTRLFANVLWRTDFAPFVAAAQRLPIENCRAIGEHNGAGTTSRGATRKACFAEVGRTIMALPGFDALDRKAYATMQTTTVFKIKVFDLRGITVYSSEHDQIGEDKADNIGWKAAIGGLPASELTHRDRFSAFEGMVENRDLISSYVPVRAPGSDTIAGVFEIYSDATPFLARIKAASEKLNNITQDNQAMLERSALANRDKVSASSLRFLGIVYGLLAMLYVALLLLVRNGQRIIDAQARDAEQSARREQLWHREKMAALATMAANVSHEVGNPLAIISGYAQAIAERKGHDEGTAHAARGILEQTWRMGRMTREIADFARSRGENAELVDVNSMVKAVCDFLRFDSRFAATDIEFRPAAGLPACTVVPDHLNEVLMGLLQGSAQGEAGQNGERSRIVVATQSRDGNVVIRVTSDGDGNSPDITERFPESLLDLPRRRVATMGADLSRCGDGFEISLPASGAAAA